MSVAGVTVAVRTALAAAITTGGLECRKYDTWDVDQGNIATLGLVKWGISDWMDQRYGFHTVTIPVLVYQIIDAGIDQSLGYQEANVENVVDGLSADRTLGGKVASSEVGDDLTQEYYRTASGAAYAVASFDVAVKPFPNMAS